MGDDAEKDAGRKHRCCACCEGVAKDDHVEHGGSIEKDSHDGPCESCEFEERIRPRLAQAWREGVSTALDFATRNEDGITLSLDLEAHPNPYAARTIPPAAGGTDA